VHGIRFLSIAWVMFGHKFYYSTFVAPPPATAASAMPWTSGLLLNTYLSVDTFLLISALLSARAVARAATMRVPLFYALRFARIWPPLAAVVFFTACASAVVGSGPLWWPLVVSEAQYCQNTWWTSLIFLNNYLDQNVSSVIIFMQR
jgi:peptidoglycan/LPS O-acetylase OafA/YrhL